MDRHLNIFNGYAHGRFGEAYRELVLEDNVTRALIIALHNSPAMSTFVISRLLGFPVAGPWQYDLQTKIEGDEDVGQLIPESHARKFIICIAPDKRPPSEGIVNFIDKLVSGKIEGQLKEKSEKAKLRKILGHCLERDENGEPKDRRGLSNLAALLEIPETDIEKLNYPTLRYLYELTFGSRPDAIATSKKPRIAILIENKVHGGIAAAQIVRHIRENFGKGFCPKYSAYPEPVPARGAGEIIVRTCTWRDIFSLCKAATAEADARVQFVVSQFLEYLEDNNMGEIKFTRQDFLDWEKEWKGGSNREFTLVLKDRIGNLAEDLARRIGDSWVHHMKLNQYSLICNIVNNKYPKQQFKPVDVPHLSLLLDQVGAHTRCLRFFIQCEGKQPMRQVFSHESSLQAELPLVLEGLGPGFEWRVEKKFFVRPGAHGRDETQWALYWQTPLALVDDSGEKRQTVQKAFQALKAIRDLPKRPGATFLPVLQMNYVLGWRELEDLGTAIEDKLMEAYQQLQPYYNTLIKYVNYD